ncbi:hypothetical protein ACSMXN_17440 [Jatrophihabitans sp. DSM 45814]
MSIPESQNRTYAPTRAIADRVDELFANLGLADDVLAEPRRAIANAADLANKIAEHRVSKPRDEIGGLASRIADGTLDISAAASLAGKAATKAAAAAEVEAMLSQAQAVAEQTILPTYLAAGADLLTALDVDSRAIADEGRALADEPTGHRGRLIELAARLNDVQNLATLLRQYRFVPIQRDADPAELHFAAPHRLILGRERSSDTVEAFIADLDARPVQLSLDEWQAARPGIVAEVKAAAAEAAEVARKEETAERRNILEYERRSDAAALARYNERYSVVRR